MYENIRDYPTIETVVHQGSVQKRIISGGIILFCIFLIGFSLYGDGVVGLSDNGDFLRVMVPNYINYTPNGRTPFAFQRYYSLTLEGNSRLEKLWKLFFTLKEPYHTTQNIFVKLSILANMVYQALTHQNYQHYDIFWLGFLYYMAYVVAIGTIINSIKRLRPSIQILGGLFFILVFCDVGYVTYFNSFYGEPLQLVTFLWIAASVMGVLSAQRRKPFFIVLFYISVVFFAGAKYANIPQGIFLSTCGLVFLCYFTRKRAPVQKERSQSKGVSKIRFIDEERIKKRSWNYISGMRFLILSLFGLSLLACCLFYESVPNWMDKHTTYQSVFYGILKDSDNPQADLEALGIPQKYIVLAGTTAYMSEHKLDVQSEDFQQNFYKTVDKFDILAYYLTHPARLIEKLSISCQNSVHIRPVYLGNYDESYERPKFREDIGLWSRMRTYLPFDSLIFTVLVFILSGAVLFSKFFAMVRTKRYEPGTLVGLVFSSALVVINAMNLVIPIMANGEADLAKHMFAFIMGFDLQVMGLIFWLCHKFAGLFYSAKKLLGEAKQVQGLRAFLLILLALIAIFTATPRNSPFSALSTNSKVGDVVIFGSMGGNPLLWRVIDRKGDSLQLLALKPVTHAAFSAPVQEGDETRRRYGSNFWPDSDLRKWLNGDFLACFSSHETKLIEETIHQVILSIADKHKATSGEKEFFWTHVPAQAAYGVDEAYCMTVADKVFLLDVAEYASLYQKGLERYTDDEYWLETPYYNNSSMVRTVNKQGYVLMKDAACQAIGVRPSLKVKLSRQEGFFEDSQQVVLEAGYDP